MSRRAEVRLSKAVVERLEPPPEGGSLYVGDSEVPGFAVRVHAGAGGTWRAYVYRYRPRGERTQRYVTIGEHGQPWTDQSTGRRGTLTCEVARGEALRLRGLRNAGADPAATYRTRARAPSAKEVASSAVPTVREFAARYLAKHSDLHKATSTALADRARLEQHILPRLGALRLDAVGPEHVAELQAALHAHPVLANRCVALVSHIYTLAGAGGRRGNWRVLPAVYPNPCTSVERFREPRRERYLTPAELRRVGRALEAEEEAHPYEVAAVRILMYTGARPSEVFTLRREQLRLEAGVVMQASKTGPRPIRFAPEAVSVMRALPEVEGNPFLFADRRRAGHPVTRWMVWQLWKRVREAAECPDVHLYDVRHTFASVALAGGGSLEFIGGLLGHTKPETTQRYAHLARAAEPMRRVGEKAAREIAAALQPPRRRR